eukprot:1477614-Rhodomonas_salina.1
MSRVPLDDNRGLGSESSGMEKPSSVTPAPSFTPNPTSPRPRPPAPRPALHDATLCHALHCQQRIKALREEEGMHFISECRHCVLGLEVGACRA